FSSPICCANIGNRPFHHHHIISPFSFGPAIYAVPYYVPVVVDVPTDDSMVQPQPDPYLGGPTIFDRRGPGMPVRETLPEPPPRAEQVTEAAQPAPQIEPAPAADQPETVLIFRDGHKLEVQNYAIVGNTLYDMTPDHRHKITLAELDI